MKKIILVFILSSFMLFLGFSATLGIFTKTWSGCLGSCWTSGIYVESTALGYPAYGKLIPGDVITEAVIAYSCPTNCNPCVVNPCQVNPCQTNPCQVQPCNPPNVPLSFISSRELRDQLCTIENMGLCYRYKRIYNWRNMEYVLDTASPCATLILRLYRTQQCAWTIVSIPLNVSPCPSPCAVTVPCYQQPCVTNCNPCNYVASSVVYSPAVTVSCGCYPVQIIIIP